jgi:hypothetical protein
MRFWEALRCLESGYKITHPCFNKDKVTYIYMDVKDALVHFDNGDLFSLSCVPLNDNLWEIHKVFHDYHWALEQMKLGKSVTRSGWHVWQCINEKHNVMIETSDTFATDWFEYKV